MGGHLSHLKPEPQQDFLQASCGPVRGNVYKHDDKIVNGYLGIPYAKPPARFQKAELAEPWLEVKDCTKYGPRAPPSGSSAAAVPEEKKLSADEQKCLTINVFVPKWESDEFKTNGRPVMVFIHGGGFEFGSSVDYDDYSISGTLPLKDVIVVTFNYRLGVLGFFTTYDKTCLGNFGLWDQTLALTWVQKHIRSFGGDPNNVTVFGQSAGGASADLLSLSPHSRNLFHKFIPMSGSALSGFAIRSAKLEAEICEEYAKHKGYTGSGPVSLVEWYSNQTSVFLSDDDNFKNPVSQGLDFNPNFDGDFFPDSLDKLRQSAPKKAILAGVCEYEGLLFASMRPDYTTAFGEIEKMLVEFVDKNKYDNVEEVRRLVYEYYTSGGENMDEDKKKKRMVEFLGDVVFNIGVFDTVRSATKCGNDVFLYTFAYCNPDNFGMFSKMMPFLENGGQHYRITGDEEGNESGMVDEYHGSRWKFLDQIREHDKSRKMIFHGL